MAKHQYIKMPPEFYEMLGKQSDVFIAEKFGVSTCKVGAERKKRNICRFGAIDKNNKPDWLVEFLEHEKRWVKDHGSWFAMVDLGSLAASLGSPGQARQWYFTDGHRTGSAGTSDEQFNRSSNKAFKNRGGF